ncbi:MAG: OmpA family protein, partial [Candidatus Pacebacteria bacterium]|nr:OmpA family protein [Candidatus Paceibacterota bacterium]
MGRQVTITVMVVLLFAVGGVGYYAWEQHRQLQDMRQVKTLVDKRLASLQDEKGQLEMSAAEQTSKVQTLEERLETAEQRVARLQQEKQAVADAQEKLARDMRDAVKSREVTISQLKGKLTVTILERVMFDSGRAELKLEGKNVLAKIAAVLQRIPNRQVLVVGHTDNVPIHHSRHRFDSNWELSTARATAAVRYLAEEADVDPTRLGAAGYGEHHPIADNSTP